MRVSCISCGLERELSDATELASSDLRCPRCGQALVPVSARPEDADYNDADITTLYVKGTGQQLAGGFAAAPVAPSVDPFGATLASPSLAAPEPPRSEGANLQPPPAPVAFPVAPQPVVRRTEHRSSGVLSVLGLGLLFVTVATVVGVMTYFFFRTDLMR